LAHREQHLRALTHGGLNLGLWVRLGVGVVVDLVGEDGGAGCWVSRGVAALLDVDGAALDKLLAEGRVGAVNSVDGGTCGCERGRWRDRGGGGRRGCGRDRSGGGRRGCGRSRRGKSPIQPRVLLSEELAHLVEEKLGRRTHGARPRINGSGTNC